MQSEKIVQKFINDHKHEYPEGFADNDDSLLTAIESYLDVWTDNKSMLYYKNRTSLIPKDLTDLQVYISDKACEDFQKLLKIKVPEVPTNSTPINNGTYMYWITLTPPKNIDKSLLRDFIKYLSPLVPNIFGCFETGDNDNDNFHSHLLVELSTKFDKSKAPWQKYFKTCKGEILHKKNFEQCKNYQYALLKARYCVMDTKNNHGYFGNYKYWDDLFKEKTGQIIKAGYTDFPKTNYEQ